MSGRENEEISLPVAKPDTPPRDTKITECNDPGTVTAIKEEALSPTMEWPADFSHDVKQQLSQMQALSCQLTNEMICKITMIKVYAMKNIQNLIKMYKDCHQLLRDEEEMRLSKSRTAEEDLKLELEDKLLGLIHIMDLLKKNLPILDPEEDQLIKDVLALQGAAWGLFEQLEERLNTLHSTATKNREKIVETFCQLHQYVLKEERARLVKNEDWKQKAIVDLQSKLSLLSNLSSSVATMCFKLEKGNLANEDIKLLSVFRAQFEDLSKYKVVPHDYVSPFYTHEWRGIRHVVKPFRDSLQFDPSSVHCNLALSKNLRQVRFSALPQPVKSKNCFDPGLYVLGVPGFQSGQHYWEVDVGHKSNWIVGVVKESVPRKGPQDLVPAKGFWVLNKQHDNVYIACGLSCPVPMSPLLRIGVFVDSSGCHLAFYDIDTSDLIFEVTGCQFEGKLFPFFCPGVPTREEDLGPLTLMN